MPRTKNQRVNLKNPRDVEHLDWYLILDPSAPPSKHIYANTRGAFDKDDKCLKKKGLLAAAMQNASLMFLTGLDTVRALSLTGISSAGDKRDAMTTDVSSL